MANKKSRGSKRSSSRSSPKKVVSRRVVAPAKKRKSAPAKRKVARKVVRRSKPASKPRGGTRKKLVYRTRAVARKPAKKSSSRSKPKKRLSYKEEYVKLLEKNNKIFSKEIRQINKRLEQESGEMPKPEFPTGGKTNYYRGDSATVKDVLQELQNIRREMEERNQKMDAIAGESGHKGNE